jgi:pimeloyl-ACP methyl ester carboxylesterase
VAAAAAEPTAGGMGDASAGAALLGAGDADEDVLDDESARGRIEAMLTEAYVQGSTGLAADIVGYSLHAWDFAPSEVTAKVLLLYGREDATLRTAHGRWWQQRLPNARLEVCPGRGHLLVVPMWARVLSHLYPRR